MSRRARDAPPLLALLLAVGWLATACSSASDLIPGGASPTPAAPQSAVSATPPPIVAPPILAPSELSTPQPLPAALPADALSDILLASSVVQVQVFDSRDGLVVPLRNGSGVVIDTAARLILTSYVLVDPYLDDTSAAYTLLAIAVSANPSSDAQLTYEAELVAADRERGLAVIRATRHYRGEPLQEDEFSLLAAMLGNASDLTHADALRLFGYPGIDLANPSAPEALRTTRATVTGFGGDVDVDGRAWVKTDARLPYGHGGGPAFDAAGRLVGIATQIAYAPGAPIGLIRPFEQDERILSHALRLGTDADYRPPLMQSADATYPTVAAPGTGGPASAVTIAVTAPSFAANAIAVPEYADLFDYARLFPAGLAALYYEFVLQGVPAGATVEERWYLEGVLQDALSASSSWTGGGFALVSDGLRAPVDSTIPTGTWRLEIWVDGVLAAAGEALLGRLASSAVTVDGFYFAPSLVVTGARAGAGALRPPAQGDTQLLGFFDFSGAGDVRQLRWVIFRDGDIAYQSPLVPWQGGDAGSWWVGYSGHIGPGHWEFEIYLDDNLTGTGTINIF